MTILDDIVASARQRLRDVPLNADDLRVAATAAARERTPHAFREAISQDRINVIAEIKSASPSAGAIVENPDVEAIAEDYRSGGAAALSVVTEPEFFRGSRDWLVKARNASGLPVVMKDFIVDPLQLLEGIAAGADGMLLLASLLDANTIRQFTATLDEFGCDALVEVHDESELTCAIEAGSRIIGVNNRDLKTFRVQLATSERLAQRLPPGVIRVAESGIGAPGDVARLRAAGYNAFLVGESLLRQNDRAAAVRRLCGGGES